MYLRTNLGVILVKLKRRVAFKSHVWEESIRVNKIREAAMFLQNSEVYRKENIYINFDNFENVIRETTDRLIKDWEYDSNDEVIDDCESDDYSIVDIECELPRYLPNKKTRNSKKKSFFARNGKG